MNPELKRSDDRGEVLATTEQSAEPATSPETVQHQPADNAGQLTDNTGQLTDNTGQLTDNSGQLTDNSGQLTDDSGRSPTESHQAVGESDHAVGRSEGLAAPRAATQPATGLEPGQAADRDRDAADAQAIELAADQTDGALLADAGLRAGWQRIQVGFVDDPREAVADAADLVEHAAQAFVGALQQRQRRLRDIWNGDGRPDGAAEPITDTEQLRLVMQRYRSLFDQLCRP